MFIFSTFLLSCGEMLISPILYSVTTRFSNPKYLAIVLSLVTIPSMLFYKVSGRIGEYSSEIGFNTIFFPSLEFSTIMSSVEGPIHFKGPTLL